jgi:hypothetical protein
MRCGSVCITATLPLCSGIRQFNGYVKATLKQFDVSILKQRLHTAAKHIHAQVGRVCVLGHDSSLHTLSWY